MNKLIASLFLFVTYGLHAQKSASGLINAEKSFADYSVTHGTKNAFLHFADSNGVVFEQGQAVNAIETWNKREDRHSVLNWRPRIVEISSSNDFGFTIGYWQLKSNAASDSIIAGGQFVTVWHVDKNNDWKFLVDLGVSDSPKPLSTKASKFRVKKITGETSTESVLRAEQDFIEKFRQSKSTAYGAYRSRNSILVRNGHDWMIGGLKQWETLEQTPQDIQFTITGSGIASSGDLAYVYGNTIINGKNENYLHIWRKEKHGWKIALEVLRY